MSVLDVVHYGDPILRKKCLPVENFINLSKFVDDMFDTKNNADDLIIEKLSDIQNLIKQSQCLTWLNFDSKPFTKLGPDDDRADDNSHPGPIANKNLCKQLTDYYAKLDNNS